MIEIFVDGRQKVSSNWLSEYCCIKVQSRGEYLEVLGLKFIYSEKATKFCKIFTLLLTGTT